jgi:hypothetical protein
MLTFPDLTGWEKWLADEHTGAPGLWLKLAKKGCSQTTVSYAGALDVALCFGWIDGQKRPLDDDYWPQRFTPRKPGVIEQMGDPGGVLIADETGFIKKARSRRACSGSIRGRRGGRRTARPEC